jgi:ATP adenylyltransferase
MEKLWAPWRAPYILGPKEKGCLLCRIGQQKKDIENLVLWRGQLCFVMLNRYPYNSGHLMIVPNRHEKDLAGLRQKEIGEMVDLTRKSIAALKKAMNPQGFNLGVNLGDVAGAGVEHHLHLHVVPRWKGDTNFMAVAAETKVISRALQETYEALHEAWPRGETTAGRD